ncbi:MAG: hypothetical protein V1753_09870 [Pseudomonadota bacterium]
MSDTTHEETRKTRLIREVWLVFVLPLLAVAGMLTIICLQMTSTGVATCNSYTETWTAIEATATTQTAYCSNSCFRYTGWRTLTRTPNSVWDYTQGQGTNSDVYPGVTAWGDTSAGYVTKWEVHGTVN